MLAVGEELKQSFDRLTNRRPDHRKHGGKDTVKDVMDMASTLRCEKLFSYVAGRHHDSFPNFTHSICTPDAARLKKKIIAGRNYIAKLRKMPDIKLN